MNNGVIRAKNFDWIKSTNINVMTERELRKLEGTIRTKMEEVRSFKVTLKDSGLGGLINTMKKLDEALYEKLLVDYKKMLADIKP